MTLHRVAAVWLSVVFGVGTFAGGELYGTVETAGGERVTGTIGWGVHRNFWTDRLDTAKLEEIEEPPGFQFKVFGVKLFGDDGKSHPGLSIPFGHLRSIENRGRSAVLTLKNGSVVEAQATGGGLGPGMPELEVSGGESDDVRSFKWHQIRRVEFQSGPGPGRDAERLFGTVELQSAKYTGYLVWDHDESLVGDVMDGEADGEDREIPFGKIAVVERLGSRGSRVTLRGGTTLEMTGTNDVNGDHRGMIVFVPGLGSLDIAWRDVVLVRFAPPPPSPAYDTFDGGYRLRGTVHTGDGTALAGEVVWDRDERWSWETIDGDLDGIRYGLPFENIRRIEPRGDHSAEVVLRDGRTFRLQGSNDVNDENRGIVVIRGGENHVLAWSDVRRLELDAPPVSDPDPQAAAKR